MRFFRCSFFGDPSKGTGRWNFETPEMFFLFFDSLITSKAEAWGLWSLTNQTHTNWSKSIFWFSQNTFLFKMARRITVVSNHGLANLFDTLVASVVICPFFLFDSFQFFVIFQHVATESRMFPQYTRCFNSFFYSGKLELYRIFQIIDAHGSHG